jgi:hypothetical protein
VAEPTTRSSDGARERTGKDAPLMARRTEKGDKPGELTAASRQRTLTRSVKVSGKGLLTGADATVEICPAGADDGIVFERVDVNPPVRIPANVDYTANRPRRTTMKSGDVTIETVEHCLSAITGLGIDKRDHPDQRSRTPLRRRQRPPLPRSDARGRHRRPRSASQGLPPA